MSAIDERRSEFREWGWFHLGPVFDDQLLLARGGAILDEALRERRFDLSEIAKAAGVARRKAE